jgi:hypothetical protein
LSMVQSMLEWRVGGADGVVDVIQEIMSSVRWFQSEWMDESDG